jgi:signal transduction histidine kinase
MKIIKFIIVINLFFTISAHSQNIDSLLTLLETSSEKEKLEILTEIIAYYENSSPEKTIEYSDILLETATELNEIKYIAIAYSKKGKANFYLGELVNAHDFWNLALEKFTQIENKEGEAEILNSIGSYYYKIDEYDIALEKYFLSLKLREELSDSIGMAYCLNNIGNVFFSQEQSDKALEYYEKALTIAENTTDNKIISILLNNLGIEYANIDSIEKALEYHFRSLEIKEKMNNRIGMGITLGSIGSIYKSDSLFDEALIYYHKAIDIFEEVSSKYYKALMLNYIAGVYTATDNYDLSIDYLQNSLGLAIETESLSLIADNYKELSSLYEFKNNYIEALKFHQLYHQIYDSIYSVESDERIKDMQVKYETEKKEKENEILLQEQKIKEIQIQKKNNFIYSLIGLTIFILILTLVIFNRNRIKQKLNNLLEDKNLQLNFTNEKLQKSEQNLKELVETKDKFFSIIAHDLRSPLSSLSLVSEMLDDNLEILSKEKLSHYIGSISKATGSLLNLVENLLNWASTQTGQITFNPEKVDISAIVKQNITLLKINTEKKNIKIESKIKDETFVFADINLVTAILRNLIANAIKFTNENGEIYIDANEKNDFLEISVTDTGIGINQDDINKLFKIEIDTRNIGNSSEKGTGLGLILCKEFVEKNGGEIKVISELGKGSSFIFTLKKC